MKNEMCYGHNQTLEGGKLDNGMESTVTQIDHQMFFDNEEKKQGAIIRKAGSRKLYILFYYFNKRVEKTTGLNDTAKNRQKVRTWLDRIIEKRDCGKLVFTDAFPGAPDWGNLRPGDWRHVAACRYAARFEGSFSVGGSVVLRVAAEPGCR